MTFILDYPLKNLTPAEYNPRKIDKNNFNKLKKSIAKFGIVKPVIINGTNGILTAGHQRIKAAKELNIEIVPVIKLEQINRSDEIMFNLFHNSIETNLSIANIFGIENLSFGYHFVEPMYISFEKNLNPANVKEIGKLLIKYGEWGSVVCDETGRIICNSDYAVACKILNKKLLIYKISNSIVVDFLRYISLDYGKYCFNALNIKDYNQTFCQMSRLNGLKKLRSTTYTKYVLPVINRNHRILDFGAGKCAYANMLRDDDYKMYMYEPFFRKCGENTFDLDKIIGFIDDIEKDIDKNGLFDIVVLDSVLNSITSAKMQHNVLLSCNSLLKDTGELILGTRCLGKAKLVLNQKKSINAKREIEFLDDDNYSVTFRNGVWTKQRFNTKENLKKELFPYFQEVNVTGSETRSNIYAICKKPIRWSISDYKKALNTEFNMTYPNGFKHNKHKKLVNTILKNIV